MEEDVTPAFRQAVSDALAYNKTRNKLTGRRPGDSGYLISNRSELATAVGTDKTQINNIIGPARETSKTNLVDRSAFVGPIREVLKLPDVTQITVRVTRAEVLRAIDELSEDEFAIYASTLPKRR